MAWLRSILINDFIHSELLARTLIAYRIFSASFFLPACVFPSQSFIRSFAASFDLYFQLVFTSHRTALLPSPLPSRLTCFQIIQLAIHEKMKRREEEWWNLITYLHSRWFDCMGPVCVCACASLSTASPFRDGNSFASSHLILSKLNINFYSICNSDVRLDWYVHQMKWEQTKEEKNKKKNGFADLRVLLFVAWLLFHV